MTSLSEAIPTLDTVVETGQGRLSPQFLTRVSDLRERIVARRGLDRDATVVALLGATGSGKSSLFNALAGQDIAKVNATRPTTRQVQSVSGTDRPQLLDHLGVSSRTVLDSVDENLILLDLPDIDSTESAHRQIASDMAQVVDVLVWVLDPQKYADAVVHDDFLAQMTQHADVTLVVLNQIDRVDPADRKRVISDVGRLLSRDGLSSKVLATSARTGEGVAELRSAIGKLVSRRDASEKRLAADVRQVGTDIVGASGATAPGVSKDGATSIAQAISSAAGATAVARAAGKSYRYRGGLHINPPVFRYAAKIKGDPLTNLHVDGGSSSVTALRAGTAGAEKVGVTVRQVARDATTGMHPSDQRTVAELAEQKVPTALDRADRELAGANIRGRKPVWWTVWNILQWVSFLAAVAGLLWLGGLWVADYLQFNVSAPTYRNFPIPTGLVILGILLVVLLWILGKIFLARGAKRAEARTRRKLTKLMAGEPTSLITRVIDDEVGAYNGLRDNGQRLSKVS